MVYFFKKIYCMIYIFIFCPILIMASSSQDVIIINMDEAIQRALLKNNQVRSSYFALKKASWEQKNAWTFLLPTISLNSRMVRIDDQTLAERDFRRYMPPEIRNLIPQTIFQQSYYTSLDVAVPIFNAPLFNSLCLAGANKRMAYFMDKSTRDNIIFLVVHNYLNVIRNKDILRLQRDYLSLSQLNFEKAKRLEKAGRYSKTEVLRWKVDFQQQKSIVVGSESDLRNQITVLMRLLNMKMHESLDIEDRVPKILIDESEGLYTLPDEKILSMIHLNDQELIQANAALAAAKSGKEIQKLLYRNGYNAWLPNISASYSHSWRENNTFALDDYSPKTFMINLSVPLFTSFQNITALKVSYYAYRESQEQFEDQIQNTRYILTEAANRLINLKIQRELSKTNVEYSEHNYRIVEQQREKGLISNIDFIDAKLNFQNAKLNDIGIRYDFISTIVELYYLIGKVTVFAEDD